MDDDYDAVITRRSDEYRRLAMTVAPMLLVAQYPAAALFEMLMDAYRDGAHDMHAQVKTVLETPIPGVEP